jgi:hypothetical protein
VFDRIAGPADARFSIDPFVSLESLGALAAFFADVED